MINYTCPTCAINNTEKQLGISQCTKCHAPYFMDGDVYLNEHEWVVENKNHTGEWSNPLIERIGGDFPSYKPQSFVSIKEAYSKIQSAKKHKNTGTFRIINMRTGRTVGPDDFSLVETYDPSMDLPTVIQKKKKSRYRSKKPNVTNYQTATV